MKNPTRTGLGALLSLALLGGCAVDKPWRLAEAARDDGVVRVAVQVGSFEPADMDADEAQALATAQCKAQGYRGAADLSAPRRSCVSHHAAQGTCATWQVVKTARCLGTRAASAR